MNNISFSKSTLILGLLVIYNGYGMERENSEALNKIEAAKSLEDIINLPVISEIFEKLDEIRNMTYDRKFEKIEVKKTEKASYDNCTQVIKIWGIDISNNSKFILTLDRKESSATSEFSHLVSSEEFELLQEAKKKKEAENLTEINNEKN